MSNNKHRDSKPSPDDTFIRRGDNVGRSGRWRAEDRGQKRYGHEERFHPTGHPETAPAEPPSREPKADKPQAGPYEGRFAPPGSHDAGRSDDKARYPGSGYGDAGGSLGGDTPDAGEERWREQAGAGYGEDYGVGRKADEDRG